MSRKHEIIANVLIEKKIGEAIDALLAGNFPIYLTLFVTKTFRQRPHCM